MSGQLLAAVLVAGLARKTATRLVSLASPLEPGQAASEPTHATAAPAGLIPGRSQQAIDPELGRVEELSGGGLRTPLLSAAPAANVELPGDAGSSGSSGAGTAGIGGPGAAGAGSSVSISGHATDGLSGTVLAAMACAWYAGFVVAPVTWLLVGVLRPDILHVVYVVYAAASYAASTLRLAPATERLGARLPRHGAIRWASEVLLFAFPPLIVRMDSRGAAFTLVLVCSTLVVYRVDGVSHQNNGLFWMNRSTNDTVVCAICATACCRPDSSISLLIDVCRR